MWLHLARLLDVKHDLVALGQQKRDKSLCDLVNFALQLTQVLDCNAVDGLHQGQLGQLISARWLS